MSAAPDLQSADAATVGQLHANPADLGAATVVRPGEGFTVLVVGGAPARAEQIAELVAHIKGYAISVVTFQHSPEALARVRLGAVAAVVGFDDLVGRSVRRSMVELEVSIPFVLIKEGPQEDFAAERTRQREGGVAECVTFDEVTTSVLRVALLGVVERHRAIARMQGADASSVLDTETGLFTTLALRRRIVAAIEHSDSDPDFRYAVMYVETSAIRESRHLSSSDVDALRARVGRRLASVASDFVAAPVTPTGYAVLFRGFEVGEDLSLAEALRHELQRPYEYGDDELHLDLGFGLARGRGLDANVDSAITRARAEVVVPRAPRVRMFEQAQRSSPGMRQLASELASALEHDEFAITYQPIVDLQTERPYGFEALIRWRHPDGEERPASEFINAANDTNLIVPIGYWCVESAMRQMAQWREEFDAAGTLAISMNLSAPQVLDRLFVERVRSLLMTTGLDAAAVRFEIEAGTIAEHNAQARALVNGLVSLGAKVWVEDYGLSECTVDDLRGFPLDGFKIDRRFVSRIDGTEMTSGRIRHIMTAARALGLRTLGEGIENPLQANVLKWLGCQLGQGYLYERPLAVGDVYGYLARV